jgi:phosphoglycerate dehydrogenase-like enzyme
MGYKVARVAQALGMEIIVYNSHPRLTATDRKDRNWHQAGSGDPDGKIPKTYFYGKSKEEFHTFLAQNSDILVLSLPLTASTRHIIGEQELAIVNAKAPVFLINISRGPIVDHYALLASLKKGPANGGLLAAALDVTEPEPLPVDSELWTLPNVFISPHVSSITPQRTGRAFRILEENLLCRAKGEEMINVIRKAESKL